MPRLVQFRDLTPAHFLDARVWASVHSFDHDEPWYDDTDEETFRPWDGPLPVTPSDGMFLVRANFTLADKSTFSGFVTPALGDAADERTLGEIQPQLFLASGKRVGFWLGMFGEPAVVCGQLYDALGKSADEVFPIQFSVLAGLTLGTTRGTLRGFYIVPDGSTIDSVR